MSWKKIWLYSPAHNEYRIKEVRHFLDVLYLKAGEYATARDIC